MSLCAVDVQPWLLVVVVTYRLSCSRVASGEVVGMSWVLCLEPAMKVINYLHAGLPGDDELCAGVDDTEHMTQEWMRLEQVMRMRRQPTLLTPRVRFMPAYFQMLDEAQGLEVPQSMASGGRSVAQL